MTAPTRPHPAAGGRPCAARLLRGPLWLVLGAALAGLPVACPREAGAAPAQSPAPSDEDRRQAEAMFKEGLARLQAEDYQAALDWFLQSRKLVPTPSNTANAALCLYNLARYVESLEMYERVLRDFPDKLDEPTRATVEKAVEELLTKDIGTVRIPPEIEGRLILDGHPAGDLPLAAPLRVPAGVHRIEIRRPGHRTIEEIVEVHPGDKVILRLKQEPVPAAPPPAMQRPSAAPPPPAAPSQHSGWFVEAFGGYAGGATLGSDAEDDADETCEAAGECPGAAGFLAGVRCGYLVDIGLSLEISGGYMAVSSAFRRAKEDPYLVSEGDGVSRSFALENDVSLRAWMVGLGASARVPLGTTLRFVARVTAGLLSARSSDPLGGHAIVDGKRFDLVVSDRDLVVRSTPFFVMPELGLEASWGGLRAGLVVGALVSPAEGPRFGERPRTIDVAGPCMIGDPLGTPRCAPSSGAATEGRAYGRFLLWVPQIVAGYAF